jgi:hypothetical protein
MAMTKTRTARAFFTRLTTTLVGIFTAISWADDAVAQEVQVTGPLAGAPAVRQLRLYRAGRFEIAPQVSFSLLDEYSREIYAGARLNYNITDWLALGVFGAFAVVKNETGLVSEIQQISDDRFDENAQRAQQARLPTINSRLTALNLGQSA